MLTFLFLIFNYHKALEFYLKKVELDVDVTLLLEFFLIVLLACRTQAVLSHDPSCGPHSIAAPFFLCLCRKVTVTFLNNGSVVWATTLTSVKTLRLKCITLMLAGRDQMMMITTKLILYNASHHHKLTKSLDKVITLYHTRLIHLCYDRLSIGVWMKMVCLRKALFDLEGIQNQK